jgi:hypothetical protein
MDKETEIIFAYSRAEAIADGVLVDVTETARETGFRFPVAITQAAYARAVLVPEGATRPDEKSRLWGVLYVTWHAIRDREVDTSEVRFGISLRKENEPSEIVPLKAVCGPGDNLEPVVTIMLQHED